MDAIRIENLTKKYKDVVAVDGLNLSVRQGELLSLLGVNGAGKTTAIKMLSCLTSPQVATPSWTVTASSPTKRRSSVSSRCLHRRRRWHRA